MTQFKTLITTRLIILSVAIFTAGAAIADKPPWAGGGKQEKHNQYQQQGKSDDKSHHDRNQTNFSGDRYFIDRQRTAIYDYYFNEYQAGRCPPGLAKKHNGCMPPGQAKKWAIGRPLPRDVIFYDLPSAINFGPPPPGYRYVRVASDILLISIGTGMVMDAIKDLGRQ